MPYSNGNRLALLGNGLRLEERVDCLLRIVNDETFFFGSTLAFWCLGLRHKVVLSSRFTFGESMVPQPGIGPGRPEWSRECKSRLSAISSTGASTVLEAEAGKPSKHSPASALSGPSSATPKPSSCCLLLSNLARDIDLEKCHRSFQEGALRFGQVNRILYESIRHSRDRHSAKAFRHDILLGRWWCERIGRALRSFNARLICISLVCARSFWARLCNVVGQGSPAFCVRLNEEPNGLCQHLTLRHPLILERSFKLGKGSLLKIHLLDHRMVFGVENLQQLFLKRFWGLRCQNQFSILRRCLAKTICQSEIAKARHQGTVISSRELMENPSIHRSSGYRRISQNINCALEYTPRNIGRNECGRFSRHRLLRQVTKQL